MREIKFRAWDEILHKIVEGGFIEETVQPDDMPVYHTGLSYGVLFVGRYDSKGDWVELPLMQFTGLIDKNGNEIYEGDIVKCVATSGHVVTDSVKFERGSFVVGNYFFDRYENEIIGNIYETPEFLG